MPTSEPSNRGKLHSKFYEESLKECPIEDVRALKWNSRESQYCRFRSLERIGNLDGARILDIGCGTGDFLDYLAERGIHPGFYHGIDLMGSFLEIARERHPGYRFEQADFFRKEDWDREYDYALCNGALNVKEGDNMSLLGRVVRKSLDLALKGVGVTLLKDAPGYLPDSRLFHYKEKNVRNLLENLHHPFRIYSDYANNDFTVFVWK